MNMHERSIGARASRSPVEQRTREATALAALGCFYLRQGFPERARPLLVAARALGARTPTVERNLAYALLMTNDPDGALTLLERLPAPLDDPAALAASENIKARARLLQERRARSSASEPSLHSDDKTASFAPTSAVAEVLLSQDEPRSAGETP